MIYEDGLIHADLHPGNVIFQENNNIVMLDVGMVGVMDMDARRRAVESGWYAFTNDGKAVAKFTMENAERHDIRDYAAFEKDVVEFVDYMYGKKLTEIQPAQVIGSIFNIMRRHRVKADRSYTMINVTMLVGEGIARQLDPDVNINAVALPILSRILGQPIPKEHLSSEPSEIDADA